MGNGEDGGKPQEEVISEKVYEELKAYVQRHMDKKNAPEVGDVVHDILLEAIADEENLSNDFQFSAFLQTRANRKIQDFYRFNGNGHRRKNLSLERLSEMQNEGKVFFKEFLTDDIEIYLEKQGLSVLIHDAIEGLPSPYREVVKLRVYQDVPFKAIAVALEKKDATVRQWSWRGFRMVQKKLIKQIGCLPYSGRPSNGGKHAKTKKERNGHQSSG